VGIGLRRDLAARGRPLHHLGGQREPVGPEAAACLRERRVAVADGCDRPDQGLDLERVEARDDLPALLEQVRPQRAGIRDRDACGVVTARATDWGLALLVGLLFATGVVTLFAGQRGDAWVFAVHGVGGFALAGALGWKLRRVWRRLARPARWDRRTAAGAGALALVVATLVSGVGWSSGLQLSAGGYNLLGWHFALGAVLTLAVAVHALLRAEPLRRRDLAGRRQFLRAGALAAGSYLVWELQRPLSAWVGLRGAPRNFTGSYEAGSFVGNAFPSTSWVADSPRPLADGSYRLELGGLVAGRLRLPLAELQAHDTLVATLDCTGGFYSRQQ
jgi:hypothetical protein